MNKVVTTVNKKTVKPMPSNKRAPRLRRTVKRTIVRQTKQKKQRTRTAKSNFNVIDDPYLKFAAAIINPGSLDAPFIDPDHVCPQSHGVGHGLQSIALTNANFTFVSLCPSYAGASAASLAAMGCGWEVIEVTVATMATTAGPGLGNVVNENPWSTYFGGTTAANRIFPWAMRLELIPQIPPATIQGEVWVGNVPLSVYVSSSWNQLVTFAEKIESNAERKRHVIRNSITERDLVHQPYGSYNIAASPPTYPLDERVTYIIFSPACAGTISGAAPTSWTLDINAYANYTWVPIPQPQVTSSTNAQNKKDTMEGAEASAQTRSAAAGVAAQASVQSQPAPDFKNYTMEQWDALFTKADQAAGVLHTHSMGPEAFGRLKKAFMAARDTAEALGIMHAYNREGSRGKYHMGGGNAIAAGDNLNYLEIPNYITQIQDLQYFVSRINSCWGDLSSYLPLDISTSSTELLSKMGDLINLMQTAQPAFSEARKKFRSGRVESYNKGKKVCDYLYDGIAVGEWMTDLRKVQSTRQLFAAESRKRDVSADSAKSQSFTGYLGKI
jgi:hypothetical protein